MIARVQKLYTYLRNAYEKRAALAYELRTRKGEPWQIAAHYWLNKHVLQKSNVCSVCGGTYESILRVREGSCLHDDHVAGTRYNALGMKMSASEYQDRSEALLNHDLQQMVESGEVQSLQQAHQFAQMHGWNEHGEKQMVDKTARGLGLR